VAVPPNFTDAEVLKLLEQQGYTRIHSREPGRFEVVQDRFRAGSADRSRVLEAVEAALRVGRGRVNVHVEAPAVGSAAAGEGGGSKVWRFSADLHCADCDIHYRDPTPSLFSFNSPLGACDTCRGFGRVIGVDYGLVVPDASKTLRGGAIRPWQTESYRECQDDLAKFARKRGVPVDTPWRDLTTNSALGDRRRGPVGEEGLVRRAPLLRSGSRPRATRCTCACCCRSTAATRRARTAAGRGSRTRRCCGGWALQKTAGRGLEHPRVDAAAARAGGRVLRAPRAARAAR
jgi:hypothetical protein